MCDPDESPDANEYEQPRDRLHVVFLHEVEDEFQDQRHQHDDVIEQVEELAEEHARRQRRRGDVEFDEHDAQDRDGEREQNLLGRVDAVPLVRVAIGG